jgi:hypothetical protein
VPAPEDRSDGGPEDAAGEPLGVFTSSSAWPIALAAGTVLVAGGLAYGMWLAALGLVATAIALVGLARE